MAYTEEPDGTRVYSNGFRYKPVAASERKIRKLKPDDAEERGVQRWRGVWLDPLPLLPEEERQVPWTRPDSEAIDSHELGCACLMCKTVPRVREKKRERLLRRA